MTDTQLLTVTSSPHMKHKTTTQKIMLDVIIAMLPALGWAVYRLGFRTLVVTVACVVTCVFCEFIFDMIMKKPSSVYDLSAVVTGILISFNVPVTIPLWMPVLGSVFAIIIVKMLFGGIGKNIVNPAIAARVFLFISFPSYMMPTNTNYTKLVSSYVNNGVVPAIDTVASPTPLAQLASGADCSASVLDMFLGNINGVIGEISALCLIIGGIYLLCRRVITWHIPVAYLASAAVISLIAAPEGMSCVTYTAYQLFGGGIMLAAIFMATDYVTSPVTRSGKIIFGIGCGIITMSLRLFSSNAEGASFAIMIMNMLVWYIDKFTMPKKFGNVKKPKPAKPEKSKSEQV